VTSIGDWSSRPPRSDDVTDAILDVVDKTNADLQ
jgi:hypothetical protein